MAGGPCSDVSLALFELQKKRQEEEELLAEIKERSQTLVNLRKRSSELQVRKKIQRNEHFNYLLLKEQDTDQAAEKAEKERKEVVQVNETLKSLMLDYNEVMGMKLEQDYQIQRHSLHRDLLERTVRVTKFNCVQELTDHIENLLYFQDHFCEREDKAHEQVDQLKKSMLLLQDNHHFQQMQDNYQLSQLQGKMEKMRSDTLSLERKWNQIEKTAAKKTLVLGKIKIATFNLYEMANEVEGDKPMDMNDTFKQLDKVKIFIHTYSAIVKQHAATTQKYDGQEKDKTTSIAKNSA